jgi:formamidopyrimidine-DNA glycosylase
MPELPEVETVARLIRPRLAGRSVRGVLVRWKRTLGGMSARAFEQALVGARITAVWRRAKFVVIDLERDAQPAGWLVGHLRMTGRIHVEPAGWDASAYERVRLELDDGHALHFIDVRKFGRLWFTRDLNELLGALGPEPLSSDFTAAWFAQELHARRRLLKPLLLDQSFVAGLGNIYVDESLHRARLHPLRRSDSVKPVESERLHAAIRAVLTRAIEREGSSFDAFYRTPEGKPGGYQDEFAVYDREGEPCVTCKSAIIKIVVGQRGTHFCRTCQRAPRTRRRRSVTAP